MNKDKIAQELENIAKLYYKDDEEYYFGYRYDENDEEFNIRDELCKYLDEAKIDYQCNEEEGFDSCGFSENFLAIAYKVNNGNNFGSELGLFTIVLECR